MMTPRERILAVYNGQKPDRVPYMLDLSHYYLHKFQLPWDLCNGYPKPDTGLMDFTKKMNREIIKVTNLREGTYNVSFDGEVIGIADIVDGVASITVVFNNSVKLFKNVFFTFFVNYADNIGCIFFTHFIIPFI